MSRAEVFVDSASIAGKGKGGTGQDPPTSSPHKEYDGEGVLGIGEAERPPVAMVLGVVAPLHIWSGRTMVSFKSFSVRDPATKTSTFLDCMRLVQKMKQPSALAKPRSPMPNTRITLPGCLMPLMPTMGFFWVQACPLWVARVFAQGVHEAGFGGLHLCSPIGGAA